MLWMLVASLGLLGLVLNLAGLTMGGLAHLLLVAALGLAVLAMWRRRAARP